MNNVSRFTPMCSGRMHLGHLWCGVINYVLGDPQSFILRLGDTAANIDGEPERAKQVEKWGQDFVDNFERFGIPVAAVIKQSERKSRYECVSERVFGKVLSWEEPGWKENFVATRAYPFIYTESTRMGTLSRVIDDHDWGVRNIVMGMDFIWMFERYGDYWDMAFGKDEDRPRPISYYIPEVMSPDKGKISKSTSRDYFLSDLPNLDPFKTLNGLALKQLRPISPQSSWWSQASDVADILVWLRRYFALAMPSESLRSDLDYLLLRRWKRRVVFPGLFNPDPPAVTEEDLKSWSQ